MRSIENGSVPDRPMDNFFELSPPDSAAEPASPKSDIITFSTLVRIFATCSRSAVSSWTDETQSVNYII